MADEPKGVFVHVEIKISEDTLRELNKTLEHLKTMGPLLNSLSGIAGLFGKKKTE
jgi:hypothetical protein